MTVRILILGYRTLDIQKTISLSLAKAAKSCLVKHFPCRFEQSCGGGFVVAASGHGPGDQTLVHRSQGKILRRELKVEVDPASG